MQLEEVRNVALEMINRKYQNITKIYKDGLVDMNKIKSGEDYFHQKIDLR